MLNPATRFSDSNQSNWSLTAATEAVTNLEAVHAVSKKSLFVPFSLFSSSPASVAVTHLEVHAVSEIPTVIAFSIAGIIANDWCGYNVSRCRNANKTPMPRTIVDELGFSRFEWMHNWKVFLPWVFSGFPCACTKSVIHGCKRSH